MREQCVGVFGRLFGHRFRARFNEASLWPDRTSYTGPRGHISPDELVKVTVASKNITRAYAGDVCERCGLTLNLAPPEPASVARAPVTEE